MSNIRLIALDLDGTTLNNHHELSDKTTATLRRLSGLGMTIAIVTGRSKPSAIKYITSLNLSTPVPIICYNGSMGFIINGDRYEQIFSLPIAEEPARILLNLADKLGLVAQYYNGDSGDVYAAPTTDEHRVLLGKYAGLVGKEQNMVTSYDDAISKSPSAKMLLLTNDADGLIEIAEKELPANTFHIIRGSPDPFFVEFLRPGVDKGLGLSLLCKHLDIPMSETVAFGDGENDKEFLKMAGVGCAMKNARPAAKEAADIVIEWTNDEDGVANQLEKMKAEGMFFIQK